MKIVASVTWIPAEAGGREFPPAGPRYVTDARFREQSEADWLRESWSIVLEFISPLDEKNTQLANVRFLVPEAPIEWLYKSNRFSMYEGRKRTADCEILSVDDS
jgi:hypothetical protein